MRSASIARATRGLGGLEFACAIPGTAGGGVRMNAGAYGRDWSDVLVRALVVTRRRRGMAVARTSSGSRTGTPRSAPARSSRASSTGSSRGHRPRIKATVAELVARRKDTQPTNKRTFGSVFKNPAGDLGAGRMLELCGLKGHRIGGAMISPKHANFIENAGSATSADCVALMVEARRRAHEEYGVVLEREVVFAAVPDSRRSDRGGNRSTRPRSGRLRIFARPESARADLRLAM